MGEPLIGLEDLQRALDGRELPGAEITVEPYESALADYALLAPQTGDGAAHPVWLVLLAVRGMGIGVDELCALAAQRPQDTLLIGNCELALHRPVPVAHRLRTSAVVGPVVRKESRDGSLLDFLPVRVVAHDLDDDVEIGVVTNGYVIKRGC